MSKETFETSRQNGPHSLLLQLEGTWEGMTKTFFEPGVLADESVWSGTIKPILNGMFMLHQYKGSLQGKIIDGIAIYGFSILTGKLQSAWIDSFHNGTSIMFSQGERTADKFNVNAKYEAPDGSPPWGWRTEINVVSRDNIVIKMYNITPEGEEALAVETDYHRKS